MPPAATSNDPSASGLWFGFLGGGMAWFAHLLLVYAIAEFGCANSVDSAPARDRAITGMLVAASVVTFAVAAGATALAWRNRSRLMQAEREQERGGLFLAHAGAITSGLFTLTILVQSIPILFFLRGC